MEMLSLVLKCDTGLNIPRDPGSQDILKIRNLCVFVTKALSNVITLPKRQKKTEIGFMIQTGYLAKA